MAKGLVTLVFAGDEAECIRRYARAMHWSLTEVAREAMESQGVFSQDVLRKIEEDVEENRRAGWKLTTK